MDASHKILLEFYSCLLNRIACSVEVEIAIKMADVKYNVWLLIVLELPCQYLIWRNYFCNILTTEKHNL